MDSNNRDISKDINYERIKELYNQETGIETNEQEIDDFIAETGKNPLWKGKLTANFIKWKVGKPVYSKGKRNQSIYVTDEFFERVNKTFKDKMRISEVYRRSTELITDIASGDKKDFDEVIKQLEWAYKNLYNEDLITSKEKLTYLFGKVCLLKNNYCNLFELIKDKKDKNDENEQIQDLKERSDNILESLEAELSLLFLLKENPYLNKNLCDILFIDNDDQYLGSIIPFFENKDFKIEYIYDIIEAYKFLKKRKPQVIFINRDMPLVSGLTFSERLKMHSLYSDIYILMYNSLPSDKKNQYINEILERRLDIDQLKKKIELLLK